MEADRRCALLTAALEFLQLRQQPPETVPLRRRLNPWTGLGAVVTGSELVFPRSPLNCAA